MTKLEKYRVNGICEEFDCPGCGAPVFHGETAYEDSANCYCSKTCQREMHEHGAVRATLAESRAALAVAMERKTEGAKS